MVPIVQAIFSGNLKEIPIPTWGACLLAFTGVVIMGLDGKESMLLLSNENGGLWSSLSSSLSTFTQGDLLIVLAALVYTLHVVRLGKYAKETTPLKLAASKATTEAMLSVGLVSLLWFIGNMASGDASGLLGYAQETGRGISTFFSTISEGLASGAVPRSALVPALCATIWTGLVTCAYTIYAQSFGQRRVSPTEANLIYTVQPIFTALFAWGLLGETLGPAGFIGAACIGSSVYTVAMMNNK
jgi:drug/metabolite transporter (DMT)-like permease